MTVATLLILDFGTTTSRVRLWRDGAVAASVSRPVGARNVAMSGSNEVLKTAVKEGVDQLLAETGLTESQVEAIVASGMITSNMGLLDIPHLAAPAGAEQLAAALVRRDFPDISAVPFYFVPGVKTGFAGGAAVLGEKDMMRGEEAEIFGYLNSPLGQADGGEAVLFLHYGSHHKGIILQSGNITGCRTSVTGELMMAVSQNTILKSSLLPLNELRPEPDWVRVGLELAEREGFGRALFSTRVLDVMEGGGKAAATSFFLGVLLSLDFALLAQMLSDSRQKVVLYGKELFPRLFAPLLRERYPQLDVAVIPEEEADRLSATGAAYLYSIR